MEEDDAVKCERFSFTLNIKVMVPDPQPVVPLTLMAWRGQSLLLAMREHHTLHSEELSFQTKAVGREPHLVAVNGTSSGPNRFWNAVLYDQETEEVSPVDLQYQPEQNQQIYLRFSQF